MLEGILRLPRWLLTAAWIASEFAPPPLRVFSGEDWRVSVAPIYHISVLISLAFWVWIYALYDASVQRTPSTRPQWRDRTLFGLTASACLITVILAHIAYSWRGQPPAALLIGFAIAALPAAIGMLAVTWLAARALETFEKATGAQRERQRGSAFFAILFFPLGIWFLHDRIQTMLAYPASAKAATAL